MSELAIINQNLPDTIEDLARFVLIAPEKVTALRAQIRAIQKAGLAKEVYDQKVDEQRRLSEMVLDASVRLGELTQRIPKANGMRADLQPSDSAVDRLQTKAAAIAELGFTPKQVERFEILANNKDLVDAEKAQAREESRAPTRTNVINLAAARKAQHDREIEIIDENSKICQEFLSAVYAPLKLLDASEIADAFIQIGGYSASSTINVIDSAVAKLEQVKFLLIRGMNR